MTAQLEPPFILCSHCASFPSTQSGETLICLSWYRRDLSGPTPRTRRSTLRLSVTLTWCLRPLNARSVRGIGVFRTRRRLGTWSRCTFAYSLAFAPVCIRFGSCHAIPASHLLRRVALNPVCPFERLLLICLICPHGSPFAFAIPSKRITPHHSLTSRRS